MGRATSLTRKQKECVSAHYLKADDWLLVAEWTFYYKIIHKTTKKIRYIDKFIKQRRKNNDCCRFKQNDN